MSLSSAALAEAQPQPIKRFKRAVDVSSVPGPVSDRKPVHDGQPAADWLKGRALSAEERAKIRTQAFTTGELLAEASGQHVGLPLDTGMQPERSMLPVKAEQANPERDCPQELAWIMAKVEEILASSESSVEGKLIAIAENLRVLRVKIRNKLATDSAAADLAVADENDQKAEELSREIRLRLRSQIIDLLVNIVQGQGFVAGIPALAEAVSTALGNDVLVLGEEEIIGEQVIALLLGAPISQESRHEALVLVADWHFISLRELCSLINSEVDASSFVLSTNAQAVLAELEQQFPVLEKPEQLTSLHDFLVGARKKSKRISATEEVILRRKFRDKAMNLILRFINEQTVSVGRGMLPIKLMEAAMKYGFVLSWGREEKQLAQEKLNKVLIAMGKDAVESRDGEILAAIIHMAINNLTDSALENARLEAAKARLGLSQQAGNEPDHGRNELGKRRATIPRQDQKY